MPRSLDELVKLRAEHPDAVVIAGGTDLGLKASKDREQFPKVILTGAVEDMCSVAVKDGALEIGGAATYTMALPLIEQHFPSFAALIRRIGSRQIRNLGTFAGNMQTASPIGDTPPCLMALGAEVTLASRAGKRTLPVEQFITGYRKTALKPDEVIASIRIPLLSGRHSIHGLQAVEAVRPGHLDGRCGIRAQGRKRQGRIAPRRLWRHGRDDEARNERRASLDRQALDGCLTGEDR